MSSSARLLIPSLLGACALAACVLLGEAAVRIYHMVYHYITCNQSRIHAGGGGGAGAWTRRACRVAREPARVTHTAYHRICPHGKYYNGSRWRSTVPSREGYSRCFYDGTSKLNLSLHRPYCSGLSSSVDGGLFAGSHATTLQAVSDLTPGRRLLRLLIAERQRPLYAQCAAARAHHRGDGAALLHEPPQLAHVRR